MRVAKTQQHRHGLDWVRYEMREGCELQGRVGDQPASWRYLFRIIQLVLHGMHERIVTYLQIK
jgi:hypothetical protein